MRTPHPADDEDDVEHAAEEHDREEELQALGAGELEGDEAEELGSAKPDSSEAFHNCTSRSRTRSGEQRGGDTHEKGKVVAIVPRPRGHERDCLASVAAFIILPTRGLCTHRRDPHEHDGVLAPEALDDGRRHGDFWSKR